jgi:transposase
MKDLVEGRPLLVAAKRSGMSENTARKYRRQAGILPREVRRYRTRKDPFEAFWPEIEGMLEAAPGLEAVTCFETLRSRPEASFSDGQLRTLQRRMRRWRAQRGPEKEVMFAQEHRPGEACQSDFTSMKDLSITIAGEPFDHLVYHFVLPYSNWEASFTCMSESFEALTSGLQEALWRLGRVPRTHRTDSLSAATHELSEGGREFNERYVGFLRHYGMEPDRSTPGRAHENGDVEQGHHRLKRAVEQALLLRGSRQFEDRGSYEAFLEKVIEARNRGRKEKLAEELTRMRDLPAVRLAEYRMERTHVSVFSTIRAGKNTYSVPSRLIGEQVEVRLYPERIEVHYAGERVLEAERLRGEGRARIDWRHVIFSLVRKPGAFARYRFREAMFPTITFRKAYDALQTRLASARADVEYVRILHLAATRSQGHVEEALWELMRQAELTGYEAVLKLLAEEPPPMPACEVKEVDLASYDACLQGVLQ